jgi:pimeloyl-ACP methyl ester carboxylesterase
VNRPLDESSVRIPVGPVSLEGRLVVPGKALGLVIFVHGSGSSRYSPRNVFVAESLRRRRLATLLFDLLTGEEDRTYMNRFNIDLIAGRTAAVTEWIGRQSQVGGLQVGYFGASTGSAAALKAAARAGRRIGAVVSRGGRPDLAMEDLPRVTAPTLLIVGGRDVQVRELNQAAYERLGGEKDLRIVPGAGHLFEEEGALEQVARMAGDWFCRHLA